MHRLLELILFSVVFSMPFTPLAASAQVPPPPPLPTKVWTETGSLGLTVTGGNNDTLTLNMGYTLTYDPRVDKPDAKNTVRSDGLFLWGKSNGQLTSDRLGLNGRDEFRLLAHGFVFGQMQYVRDQFKSIDYLIAPTGGLGYRAIDRQPTKLSFDAGLGGVWEKNPDRRVNTTGALSYADKFSHQLTPTTTLTQSFSGLHRTDDFSDILFVFNVGIAAALTTHTQLKVELLDTYKTRVIEPGFVKNDVALILALVYRNQ